MLKRSADLAILANLPCMEGFDFGAMRPRRETMEPMADLMVQTPGYPDGQSLVHDDITGQTVGFEGMAQGDAEPTNIWGWIHWKTLPSWAVDRLGDLAVNANRERAVTVITCATSGDPDFAHWTKGRDGLRTVFDFDFMRQLLVRDPEAENELVGIAEANGSHQRTARYSISHSDRVRSLIV